MLTARDTFAVLVRRRLLRQPWRVLLALPALPVLAASGARPRLRGAANRFLVRISLLGAQHDQLAHETSALAAEFLTTSRWLVHDGVRRAAEHLGRGDRVVVVTATEAGLARALLDGLGLHEAELVASRFRAYGVGRHRFGLRLDPHNYGRRKVDALRRSGVAEPWDVMYSDSLADLELLQRARRGVLVNPSGRQCRQLRRAAPGVPLDREVWR